MSGPSKRSAKLAAPTFLIGLVLFMIVSTAWLGWFLLPPGLHSGQDAEYLPATYDDLEGWAQDDLVTAFAAFTKSCEKLMTIPANRQVGPEKVGIFVSDWLPTCSAAREFDATIGKRPDSYGLHRFFETYLQPVMVTSGSRKSLFTGYYEPEISASLSCNENYAVPVYRRPEDLVTANLGQFQGDLAGQSLVGQVIDNRFVPYATRRDVYEGALANKGLELACAADPVDVFFLEIQGSGRLMLDDGGLMRVGYDGKNGHAYTSIGRELVERGEMSIDQVSLQSIRIWLADHPDQARDILEANRSYVFFRELETDSPIGAQGVELTPGRSLAIDRAFIPLGAPVWLQTSLPTLNNKPDETPFHRLMVAQDTGGAIKGAVRGDVFWGAGLEAEEIAGHMAQAGSYYLLLPHQTVQRLFSGAE